MHKIYLFSLALVAIMAGACKNTRDPKSFDDMVNPSSADSMMYYFGEMNAASYWQDAETDTALRSEKAREDFVKGFKEAIYLAKDNEAFNKGLQLGLRLAVRLNEFENRYGIDFPEDILVAALRNSLEADGRADVAKSQQGYYNIKDRLEIEASKRELLGSKQQLAKKGREYGYEMVSDTLYAMDVTPAGPGPRFKDGDRVAVYVTASTIDGKEIVARQFPDSITIGAGRVPRIVCLGIHTMTNGQTRKFMTTPRTLFGKRYATYHLPSDEPVIFTVKAEQN